MMDAVRMAQPAPSPEDDPQPSRDLYYAYRRAKAAWDAACYAEPYPGDAALDPLTAVRCDAIDAFLLAPAKDMRSLATKLQVLRDEEIADGWHLANEIASVLATDAHRLAYPNDRGPA